MQSSQAGRREEGEKVWECVCAGGQHHVPCLLNIRAIGVTLVRWGRDLCLSPAERLTPSTHLPTHLPSIHPSIHPSIYLLILHPFTFCPCIHTPTHLSSIHLLTYVFSLALLIPQPGVKPMPPAVEAWSPNHWTAREVPPPTCLLFFSLFSFIIIIIVVDFVIHWNETAKGLHVFPIPIPPPTSLSTRSL